jgi:3-oxoacyl-[acyl-carrier-protein] synthase-1
MGGNGSVSVLPHGHAAGGFALDDAMRRLAAAQWRWAAIVGADSYISAETIAWLDGNRQLHANYNAWGFIPGEAAGACVISTLAAARARSARPLALIEAVGVDQEEVPIKTDGVCLGWGLTRAVRSALGPLAPDEAVDRIYCDQNGETYRADELGFMLARLAGRFRNPGDFVAPADCWGDVGAATVPLLIALATSAAERGYAAGPLSMLLAGSESGRRAAVLLRTPTRSA